MIVALGELARRQFTADVSIQCEGIFPFAIQRLLQGRRLVLRVQNSEVPLTIHQWAFACGDPDEFIPARYSLVPVGSDTGNHRALDLCCLEGLPELYPHSLFYEERECIGRKLWSRFSGNWDLAPAPVVNLETVAKRDNVWMWRARILKKNLPYRTEHDLLLLALLEGVPNLIETSQSQIAEALCRMTADLIAVFGGKEDQSWVDAQIALLVPRNDVGVRITYPSSWSNEGDPAVDRLVEACWRRRSHSDVEYEDFLLSTLIIRRCGEPTEDNQAHARFAFGKQQWSVLEKKATQEFESRSATVAKNALDLIDTVRRLLPDRNPDEEWELIKAGLIGLGFSEAAVKSPAKLSEESAGSKHGFPKRDEFVGGVRRAFSHSFRVSDVVSNRVMNSCACELVGELWSSGGLIRNLGQYPRDTLLCEMSFLPPAVGHDLFYVPLMLPASRRAAAGRSAYFLSYAVGMCPPALVAEDTFREEAENASQDLYLGFLERIYGSLSVVAERASDCEQSISASDLGRAHLCLQRSSDLYFETARDLLRLADFHVSQAAYFGFEKLPLGVEKPTFCRDRRMELAHGEALEQFDVLARQIFESATSELRYHELLFSRRIRNLDHSGLLMDLAGPRFQIESVLQVLRSRDDLVEEATTLAEAAEEVRLAQARWSLVVNRQGGDLDFQSWEKMNRDSCRRHFNYAVKSIRSNIRNIDESFDISLHEPAFDAHLDDYAVYENPGVFREILYNLLTNRIEHEKTITKGTAWGIEIRWIADSNISGLPEPLFDAWKSWHPVLKRSHGACCIRAYPSSISEKDLSARISSAIWETGATGIGLYVLATYTRAYDAVFSAANPGAKSARIEASIPVSSVEAGTEQGVYILVPGARDE